MTPSEHILQCKETALLHCKSLSLSSAFDLLVVNLKSNRDTKNHPLLKDGIRRMFKGEIDTLEKLEEFIHQL